MISRKVRRGSACMTVAQIAGAVVQSQTIEHLG